MLHITKYERYFFCTRNKRIVHNNLHDKITKVINTISQCLYNYNRLEKRCLSKLYQIK